jgi:hypothetical protein
LAFIGKLMNAGAALQLLRFNWRCVGVRTAYVAPGSPSENGFIGSFMYGRSLRCRVRSFPFSYRRSGLGETHGVAGEANTRFGLRPPDLSCESPFEKALKWFAVILP